VQCIFNYQGRGL